MTGYGGIASSLKVLKGSLSVCSRATALEGEHPVCSPRMVIAESHGSPCEELRDCLVVNHCDIVLGPNGNGTISNF